MKTKLEIFNEGYKAYYLNIPRDSNAYLEDSEQFDWRDEGWRKAEIDNAEY